eukprot:g1252.t1
MRKILTVGDGDLSYSLALARAAPHAQQITATTLISRAELCEVYQTAAKNLKSLSALKNVQVVHGVNATDLRGSLDGQKQFDRVVFSHPHLGLDDLGTEAHRRRHACLIAHFFFSCRDILREGGHVVLGLCGKQPLNWNVDESASRCGFSLVSESASSSPEPGLRPLAPPQEEWSARIRFRNGGLGARHWLAPYGYEHRRTHSDIDMRVNNSRSFVYGKKTMVPLVVKGLQCPVCHLTFTTAEGLNGHVQTLALPDEQPKIKIKRVFVQAKGSKCIAQWSGSAEFVKVSFSTKLEAGMHCTGGLLATAIVDKPKEGGVKEHLVQSLTRAKLTVFMADIQPAEEMGELRRAVTKLVFRVAIPYSVLYSGSLDDKKQ